MTGPFGVSKRQDGEGAVRLLVSGEIDGDVSAALSLLLVNAAAQDGVERLTVDLGRVPFLAAAGVRSLLSGREEALRRGCDYRVVNAPATVADTLRAAGLAGLLRLTTAQAEQPAVSLRR
ncbi:STAS domain-containing protein [Actinoplanes sp. NPDC051861]|uniref:STAS domain-containing protein n=1 Tax=Actinoplanes sp. NPDC051861 TaxID=3155170 RepID=UPI0034219985